MAEYKSIEDLPGYQKAFLDHNLSLQSAGTDETAQLRAKMEWSDRRYELEQERQRLNEDHHSREQAISRIKEQYGDVPENVFMGRATPEEMEQAAKDFDEAVKSRIGTQQGTPPPSAGAQGQPPTSVGQAPSLNDSDRINRRFEELQEKFANRSNAVMSHAEVVEYQEMIATGNMLPVAIATKQGAKRR